MPRPVNLTDSRREERLFVSCTPGLEPALDAEVRALGVSLKRRPGGVEVQGPPGLHRRLNLWLRTASRVALRLAEFPARDVPALQAGLAAIPLRDFWTGQVPLRIGVSSHRSRLHHAQELRQLAARAWKATLATATPGASSGTAGARDEDETSADELLVQLRFDNDVCTVSIDTSGELLYLRGYRQEVSRAPLRETLAAGILTLAGYRGDEPLWDPMCGSGTLPIEAAWMALKRAPGIDRAFAFERFPNHDTTAWASERESARAAERAKPLAGISATDLNAGALGTARRNARRARVQEFLELERVDVLAPSWTPPEASGLLVANLPYGKRVGDPGELGALYSGVGRLIRERLPGWRAALLVAEPRAEQALGLEVDDAFDVQNGGIRCRLLLLRAPRGG